MQTGGPSGGCIPEQYLDTPIDYESLLKAGSMMGSGGMIVMDEDTAWWTWRSSSSRSRRAKPAANARRAARAPSACWKSSPASPKATAVPEDLEKLEKLSKHVKRASLCGLGQSAPNPMLSTMQNFRDEYEAHINDKHCPAGVCSALLNYIIDPDKCVGCSLCAKICPVKCISGEPKKTY